MGALVISLRGRPRLSMASATTLWKISGNTFDAGRALEKSSVVHSGLSSSIISAGVWRFANLTISFHLSTIGLSKTDDVYSIFSWREHNGIKTLFNVSQNAKSAFAIIFTYILKNYSTRPFQLLNLIKRQLPLTNIVGIFLRIEGNFHGLLYLQ